LQLGWQTDEYFSKMDKKLKHLASSWTLGRRTDTKQTEPSKRWQKKSELFFFFFHRKPNLLM